ncbi:MAG: hydroxyacid dehydrogenase [Pseudomonadota bacterium]
MKKVLVTEPIHDDGLALLREHADVEILAADGTDAASLKKLMPDVQGIVVRLANLTAELLERAPDLEVVSRHGVGCDAIDVAHLTARGIPVAITAGANSTSVTEHTFGLMLSLARHQRAQDAAVREGRFHDRGSLIATDLEDARLLVIGFGRIGRKVARIARAFGMEVTVADIALDEPLASELGCRAVEDFRPELPEADIVTVHVPLDAGTRHMIAGAEFAAMKPGALLINCARGGIVDEAALLVALEAGKLGGAGLDVFSTEPPPLDDEVFASLLARPDVIAAPHTGAASTGAMRMMGVMAAQNVLDCFAGRLTAERVFNPEVLAR